MRRILAFTAASLLLASAAAGAQGNPQIREGFTIGFGVGVGSAGLSCDGCGSERDNGGSGYLSIGGAVSPTLVIAGESNGWAKDENGEKMQVGYLMGVAQWYPAVEKGFFVKAGLGFGTATDEARDPVLGPIKLESTGFAYQIGTGYDVRVGRNFSLTPFVNYLATTGAKMKVNGTSTKERVDPSLFQYGLGFTWH